MTVLEEFGFRTPELSVALFLKENQVIPMEVPPIRVVILTTISGVEFRTYYAERIVDVIDDVDVILISLANLKGKQASQRLTRGSE